MLVFLQAGGWKTYLGGALLLLVGINWLLPAFGQKPLLPDSALSGLLTAAAGIGVIGLAHKGEKLTTALRESAEAVVSIRTGQDTVRQVTEALAALADLLASLNSTAGDSLTEQREQTGLLKEQTTAIEGQTNVLEAQVVRQDEAITVMKETG